MHESCPQLDSEHSWVNHCLRGSKLVLALHQLFDVLETLFLIERELADLILYCVPVFRHVGRSVKVQLIARPRPSLESAD
jgi:hypothetical protein